jgi:hypothetical protein
MRRTTASRKYGSTRLADGSRRGKPDLGDGDRESTHLARSSQWRKPGLESDEDRGSTYLDGTRQVAEPGSRRQKSWKYASGEWQATGETGLGIYLQGIQRGRAPHVKYGREKATGLLMRKVAVLYGGRGARRSTDV